MPFLLGLEPTPSVVFQCARRCAFLPGTGRSSDVAAPLTFVQVHRNGYQPMLVGQHDLEGWSIIAVSRKTLQARSEQALVVIILSTGALIAYLGLALSRL